MTSQNTELVDYYLNELEFVTEDMVVGVRIGNGNKIKNTVIAERITGTPPPEKKLFFNQHPWVSTILLTLVVSVILLFSFWEKIITWIEELL